MAPAVLLERRGSDARLFRFGSQRFSSAGLHA